MLVLNIFESCNGRTPWELLLWLIGAFILGYLLRYFLDKNKETPITSRPVEPVKTESEIKTTSPVTPKTAVEGKKAKDDLTKIEGIGPKINELLNNAGIFTFNDLASSNYDHLKKILDEAGERFRMHNPTTWPRQAGLAADGFWDELKKLQDHLKGGIEE